MTFDVVRRAAFLAGLLAPLMGAMMAAKGSPRRRRFERSTAAQQEEEGRKKGCEGSDSCEAHPGNQRMSPMTGRHPELGLYDALPKVS
jgi:hypothetical protein